jgi:hypothetical protein
MVTIVVAVVLVVAAAVVVFMLFERWWQPVPVAPASRDDFEEGVVSEPVPISPVTDAPAPAAEPQIRWTKQFEPRSGALDDQARLRLINDLGMLRAPWCVPLLVQASEEETDPAHRVAAQLALARCREENVV